MKHNDSQGFPDPFTTMTSEDWAEFDKHAEEEHKKSENWPKNQPFIPQNPNPPF
jgi:hypothetical protein